MTLAITGAIDVIQACRFCSMCRPACGMFLETRREVDSPRGVALALDRILQGRGEYTDEVADLLGRCDLCRECTEFCVGHVDVARMVLAGRADLAARGAAR